MGLKAQAEVGLILPGGSPETRQEQKAISRPEETVKQSPYLEPFEKATTSALVSQKRYWKWKLEVLQGQIFRAAEWLD